jgi:hypothetical protein
LLPVGLLRWHTYAQCGCPAAITSEFSLLEWQFLCSRAAYLLEEVEDPGHFGRRYGPAFQCLVCFLPLAAGFLGFLITKSHLKTAAPALDVVIYSCWAEAPQPATKTQKHNPISEGSDGLNASSSSAQRTTHNAAVFEQI